MLIKDTCTNCGSQFYIGNNQTPTIHIGNTQDKSMYYKCPYCDSKINITIKRISLLQKKIEKRK